jgi:Beta-lactamase superfamily domain
MATIKNQAKNCMAISEIPSIKIIQLNHASLLLVMGHIRLLTDPWFEGTAFDEGWKLRWSNSDAYARASTATHVWISHPHSDHLHYPTLKRLLKINSAITVLANRAYNYNLEKQMRVLGFLSMIPIEENQTIALADQCTVQRIGSGIIDSLMVIRWGNTTILNLNDCVLQKRALRHLAGKIGKIDLLLCNFNHAGKLLHYPEKSPEQVRQSLKQHYRAQISILRPRYVIPFASFHHYLSPFSVQQNASLLEPFDLATTASDIAKTLLLYPGQQIDLDFSVPDYAPSVLGAPPAMNAENGLRENAITREHYSVAEEDFRQAITVFEQRIARSFGLLRICLPSLTIKIIETQKIFRIRHGRVAEVIGTSPDIEANAEKVLHWFGHSFGTDAFVVGAHFRILRPYIGRLKFFIALLLLAEAKVSPRYVFTPAFWKFLMRRRHEALAALFDGRVSSSYQ